MPPTLPSTTPGAAAPDRQVARLRAAAELLDAAFRVPGTPFRVGVDAIIGLVPGAGDIAGAVMSAALIWQAARLGAPAGVLTRMLANVAIDALVGSVPLIGDLFDASYKVNLRNVAMLERHLVDPHGARAAGNRFLILLAAALIALIMATAAVAAFVLTALWRWIAS